MAMARAIKRLWGALAVQIAGRLLDLWWHATHPEFETAADQFRAHWLAWLGTILLIAVTVPGLRNALQSKIRLGYLMVLGSNVTFVGVSVVHFLQHLDHREVDLAHFLLAVTNIGSVVGVAIITVAHRRLTGRKEVVE